MNLNRNGKCSLLGLLPAFGLILIPSVARAGDFDFSLSHSGGYAHRLADGAYAGEYGAWTERMGFKQDEEGGETAMPRNGWVRQVTRQVRIHEILAVS